MKPIAIFRLYKIEGPGYLSSFLDAYSIPWKLIKIDAGENLPYSSNQFSGLVFMGGNMSVNDNLPWIPDALELIRHSVRNNIPVLGHCLGGQLMAKALGGQVNRSPVKEIGWGRVVVADNLVARKWFGNLYDFEAFHWHGEFFSLPDGAKRLLSSKFCENQAFALDMHLGMQCHVELTEEMLKIWYEAGAEEVACSSGPAVQLLETARKNLAFRISALNKVARHLYSRWISQIYNLE